MNITEESAGTDKPRDFWSAPAERSDDGALDQGGTTLDPLSREANPIPFRSKAAWRFASRRTPKSALFHSRSLAVWTRSLAEVKNSLDCGGRAQRRHRFARQSASESDVALRFPPQSKTPGTATECSPSHGPFI